MVLALVELDRVQSSRRWTCHSLDDDFEEEMVGRDQRYSFVSERIWVGQLGAYADHCRDSVDIAVEATGVACFERDKQRTVHQVEKVHMLCCRIQPLDPEISAPYKQGSN